MAQLTQTEKQLITMLRDIWVDKDFVVGIIMDLETDDERQTMIDYIEKGEEVTPENLVLLSLHINTTRNNKHRA